MHAWHRVRNMFKTRRSHSLNRRLNVKQEGYDLDSFYMVLKILRVGV